jgi:ferritin
MVISNKIETLINFRIQEEENSSRLYKSMQVWLDYVGYSGASKLFEKYSNEELIHANWSYEYLLNLNLKPKLSVIKQPKEDFKSLSQVIALTLEHEITITNQCKELAIQAQKDEDYMTLGLAQRYLKEQCEELKKAQYLVDRLELFGDEPIALRMLDEEMGNI